MTGTIDTKQYEAFTNAAQENFNRIFGEYGFSAFSDSQFKAGLLKLHDKGYHDFKLTNLGHGGFIMSDHYAELEKTVEDHNVERDRLMQDPTFATAAFYYEMCNHEYDINLQAAYDVCSMFGNVEYDDDYTARDYLAQLGFGAPIMAAYSVALSAYRRDAEENGWC